VIWGRIFTPPNPNTRWWKKNFYRTFHSTCGGSMQWRGHAMPYFSDDCLMKNFTTAEQLLAGQPVRTAFPSFHPATKTRALTHSFLSLQLHKLDRTSVRYSSDRPVYDNLIPTRFLAPIDCSKNRALYSIHTLVCKYCICTCKYMVKWTAPTYYVRMNLWVVAGLSRDWTIGLR
jgi:hypothetical protein